MSAAPQAWPRAVRLKRRRLIDSLFSLSGQDSDSVSAGVVRLFYQSVPAEAPASPFQAGFAVTRPRTAVRRNAVRRVMRETLRTSSFRGALSAAPGRVLAMMVVCRNGSVSRAVLRDDMLQALHMLVDRLKTHGGDRWTAT